MRRRHMLHPTKEYMTYCNVEMTRGEWNRNLGEAQKYVNCGRCLMISQKKEERKKCVEVTTA